VVLKKEVSFFFGTLTVVKTGCLEKDLLANIFTGQGFTELHLVVLLERNRQ
jgi:hypothetical protein